MIGFGGNCDAVFDDPLCSGYAFTSSCGTQVRPRRSLLDAARRDVSAASLLQFGFGRVAPCRTDLSYAYAGVSHELDVDPDTTVHELKVFTAPAAVLLITYHHLLVPPCYNVRGGALPSSYARHHAGVVFWPSGSAPRAAERPVSERAARQQHCPVRGGATHGNTPGCVGRPTAIGTTGC